MAPIQTQEGIMRIADKSGETHMNREKGTNSSTAIGQQSRRRLPLTDKEQRAIALARYRPNSEGKLPTWEELSPRFNDRQSRVLSRAADAAFCKRLVKVVDLPGAPPDCQRDEHLEVELRRRFRNLQVALVLDMEPVLRAAGSADSLDVDDEIHRVLGHAMAKVLAEGWVFDSGSVIGLGAGRGVYNTVDALSWREPLNTDRITAVSLTGSVEGRDYMGNVALQMDADIHGLIFARCFHRASVRFICAPIAHNGPEELLRVREQTPLGRETWEGLKVSHALVGMGVLAPGHRFFQEGRGAQETPVLAPIRKYLTSLVQCCSDIQRQLRHPSYCPVGDICHELFFVRPPSDARIPDDLQKRVNGLIKEINACLLCVGSEQLRSIKKVLVVAGTERKALAIRELLSNQSHSFYALCTDKRAALRILSAD
jgi:DNA-binding transcriptional regulator LsrR (DeoR family)